MESRSLFRFRTAAIALSLAALAVAMTGNVQAQDPDDARTNIAQPEIRTPPAIERAAIGTAMRAPRAVVVGADAPRPILTCSFVCSPYVPRQVIARIAFPERIAESR